MKRTTEAFHDNELGTDSENWEMCSICNKEFRITEREIAGLDFLKKHHRSGEDHVGDFKDAPMFQAGNLCMECIQDVVNETLKSEILTYMSGVEDDPGDKKELFRDSVDPRGNARFLKKRGLLPMAKGLGPHFFKGMGESLLQERLPHIEDHIEFLFSDFPGIEENEFFIHEMKGLFSDRSGYMTPFKPDEVRSMEKEKLKPELLMEKLGRNRARKQ